MVALSWHMSWCAWIEKVNIDSRTSLSLPCQCCCCEGCGAWFNSCVNHNLLLLFTSFCFNFLRSVWKLCGYLQVVKTWAFSGGRDRWTSIVFEFSDDADCLLCMKQTHKWLEWGYERLEMLWGCKNVFSESSTKESGESAGASEASGASGGSEGGLFKA